MNLRKVCRIELAKQKQEYIQQILDTKSRGNNLFHKLINKHKGRLAGCISELNFDSEIFKTEESILEGWHKHFSDLASTNAYEHSSVEYAKLIRRDISEIIEVCNKSLDDDSKITKSDVYEMICDLN